MKNIFNSSGLLLLFLFNINLQAQENDIPLFVSDMLIVADNFATPAAEGAAYQAGAGWFTSAEYSGLWILDFSIHANTLFIPEKKRSTSISSSDFATFDIRGGENALIPSAFGGSTDVYFEGELNFMGNQVPFEFKALEGVNKSLLIHPFIQASVGVPFGSEVSVRLLPQVEIDGVQFSTYGIGIKHNFNQYFLNPQPNDPQFAALVAYSKFNVNYEFLPVIIDDVANLNEIEVDADLWLLQFIMSKKFRNSGWSGFASAGLSTSSFGYVLGGSGIALEPMNSALETLSNNEMEFKGDVGLNYEAGKLLFGSMFSQGKYSNFNINIHYRL